ncbi:MAG TPA: NAD(P)-dependent oxidoreductase [Saprospiraceae bacterium]|nr:NAD(P)-dependent oxidoreductase [Saprospiraceae bacterium]
MKVLVTGSAGRLGRVIVELLRERGMDCVGMDIQESATTDVRADIRERKEIAGIIKNISHVIHTAAVHGRHMDMDVPRADFIETNILGTLNLLEASVEHKIKSFIYTSTTSIYGKSMENSNAAAWVDEELTTSPRDIYDITKLTAENLCRDFFDKEQLNGCTLRVSRFMDEPRNLIANYRLYRGLDERDGAEAHWLALHATFKTYEIFNISNDTPFQVADLEALKTNPEKVILKYYPMARDIYQRNNWTFPTSIDRVYVIDKAKRMLGYRPGNNFLEYIS